MFCMYRCPPKRWWRRETPSSFEDCRRNFVVWKKPTRRWVRVDDCEKQLNDRFHLYEIIWVTKWVRIAEDSDAMFAWPTFQSIFGQTVKFLSENCKRFSWETIVRKCNVKVRQQVFWFKRVVRSKPTCNDVNLTCRVNFGLRHSPCLCVEKADSLNSGSMLLVPLSDIEHQRWVVC